MREREGGIRNDNGSDWHGSNSQGTGLVGAGGDGLGQQWLPMALEGVGGAGAKPKCAVPH